MVSGNLEVSGVFRRTRPDQQCITGAHGAKHHPEESRRARKYQVPCCARTRGETMIPRKSAAMLDAFASCDPAGRFGVDVGETPSRSRRRGRRWRRPRPSKACTDWQFDRPLRRPPRSIAGLVWSGLVLKEAEDFANRGGKQVTRRTPRFTEPCVSDKLQAVRLFVGVYGSSRV